MEENLNLGFRNAKVRRFDPGFRQPSILEPVLGGMSEGSPLGPPDPSFSAKPLPWTNPGPNEHSIVIGFTGWSRHWTNPKAYRNADANGHTHFPTFELSAIEALVKKKIAGVAIDTLALEPLDSSFPAHKLLLGSSKYIIENIANAWELPPKGAYILALPLKIQKGPEAPARVIGLM